MKASASQLRAWEKGYKKGLRTALITLMDEYDRAYPNDKLSDTLLLGDTRRSRTKKRKRVSATRISRA